MTFQGSRSSIRLCGWPLAMAMRAVLREAKGSTPLILQVSISEAMPPSLCPAQGIFLRLRAMGRITFRPCCCRSRRGRRAGNFAARPCGYGGRRAFRPAGIWRRFCGLGGRTNVETRNWAVTTPRRSLRSSPILCMTPLPQGQIRLAGSTTACHVRRGSTRRSSARNA